MHKFWKKQTKKPEGNKESAVNRNRWYRPIQKVMNDLNNVYLCPMWIQIDDVKTKLVRSVDEYKRKMEEYKVDLVKSVDGHTTKLANSLNVYKAKVATSIDIFKTKVEGYETRITKDLPKHVNVNAANLQEKLDGMKQTVSSTVDQIQAVENKMQEPTKNVPEANNLRRRKFTSRIKDESLKPRHTSLPYNINTDIS